MNDPHGLLYVSTSYSDLDSLGYETWVHSADHCQPPYGSFYKLGGLVLRSIYDGSYDFVSIVGAPDFFETPMYTQIIPFRRHSHTHQNIQTIITTLAHMIAKYPIEPRPCNLKGAFHAAWEGQSACSEAHFSTNFLQVAQKRGVSLQTRRICGRAATRIPGPSPWARSWKNAIGAGWYPWGCTPVHGLIYPNPRKHGSTVYKMMEN